MVLKCRPRPECRLRL
ncbi:hypothetical protein MTR67_001896 [Solanum verrucosum]|uniref:Uncharacterized protein n=1 Tax=Solanum verrucosum TaxID=315347 RepID=A0AAF0T7W6_SOLVR|nr:hypothetical protein MTR67_001896 [Solanum verrucosum]